VGKDLARYNRMRAMSGDPPLFAQLVKNGIDQLKKYGASQQGQAFGFLGSLQSDAVRYFKMRNM
jgi:hypothetical protein